MSYPTKYNRYTYIDIPLRKVMEKINWFRKLTRTNEEHGEYFCLFGPNLQIVYIRIDEEVEGLTYYYPRTRGHDHLGDSRYFHLPDKDYIEIVGNSNDIEALTKDMRFVADVKRSVFNDLEMMFAHVKCTIDENGEEIPIYVNDEPLYHWH